IGVFQIGQVNIDDSVEQPQDLDGIVRVGVATDRELESLFGRDKNAACHLRNKVGRRYKADVMTAAVLKLKHHFSQPLVGNFILSLFFAGLRDLIILAVHAAKITVAEKYIPCPSRAA